MLSVKQIAEMAVSAAAGAISGAIHSATLTRRTINEASYDVMYGRYEAAETTQTGRAIVETQRPMRDVFPEYVAGPGDELILLEGFTACRENDHLTFAGRTRIVRQCQDILGAGAIFYVIAR